MPKPSATARCHHVGQETALAGLIEALLGKAGEPLVPVGHSYSAAAAGRAVDENNLDSASEFFINYWLN